MHIFLADSNNYHHHNHPDSTSSLFSQVEWVNEFTLTTLNLMPVGPSEDSIHIAMSSDNLKSTKEDIYVKSSLGVT